MYNKIGGLLAVPFEDIADVGSVINQSHPYGIGKHNGMQCYVIIGDALVLHTATGRVPSDVWLSNEVSSDANAEIFLDTASIVTRSITTLNTDLDFELDYLHNILHEFVYDVPTKTLVYQGDRTITVKHTFSISLARTDTGLVADMTFFVNKNEGAGFVKLDRSRIHQEYSNTFVANTAGTFLDICTKGDSYKMGLRTNAIIDLEVRNVIWTVATVHT